MGVIRSVYFSAKDLDYLKKKAAKEGVSLGTCLTQVFRKLRETEPISPVIQEEKKPVPAPMSG